MRRVPAAGDLLHGLVSLNVLLLAVFLVVFLLAKLLALLHRPGTAASDDTTRYSKLTAVLFNSEILATFFRYELILLYTCA